MNCKLFPIFQCNRNNFVFNINQNESHDSEFDLFIKKKWQEALDDNNFRYKLDIQKWKILNGEYNYLAQLNINRAENRRKPEEISSMFQPFDLNRFNFNKISHKEILLDINCGDGNNVIAINVSPIEQYHCLFIPQRLENLPQIMTKNSLQNILELMMMSNSIDLRAAFNSLGAFASVNHLHWHLYYLQHRMPLENIELNNFNNSPIHLLIDFPAKGFCVKFSSIENKLINNLTNWVFLIINYLQNNNIAHNVYITRGNSKKNSPQIFDDIRIYIWARKHSYGVKNTKAFFPAVCELFGHLSIKNQEEYDTLTEIQVAEIFKDITDETFCSVKEEISKLVGKQLLLENKNSCDI